jgi:hypothetical protein
MRPLGPAMRSRTRMESIRCAHRRGGASGSWSERQPSTYAVVVSARYVVALSGRHAGVLSGGCPAMVETSVLIAHDAVSTPGAVHASRDIAAASISDVIVIGASVIATTLAAARVTG